MNLNDAYPSNYIKHADLKGKPHVLIMSHVTIEDFDDGNKPALHFQNSKKPLLLNKTNGNVIMDLYGPETSGWQGLPIEIYPAKTEFKGRMTDCVRVRQPATGEGTQTPQQPQDLNPAQEDPFEGSPLPGNDDEVPF